VLTSPLGVALDGELAEHAFANGERQRVGSRLDTRRVVAPGQQRLATAFDIQRELTVDKYDERTGLASGPVRARVIRPRQRGAERVGRIGGGEHQCGVVVALLAFAPATGHGGLPGRGRASWLCHRTHPVDGAGHRELRPAEALDEVAAAAPPGLLVGLEHRVDRGEAARRVLGHDGAPGDDAVPVEQSLGGCMRPPGRVCLPLRQQRPTAGRRRRPGPDRHDRTTAPTRPRSRRGTAARRAEQVTQRRQRVVGDAAGPDEIPQCGRQSAVVERGQPVGQRAEEQRAAAGQRLEQMLVQRTRLGVLDQGHEQRCVVGEMQRDPAVVAR
jgi:hypothetical protein